MKNLALSFLSVLAAATVSTAALTQSNEPVTVVGKSVTTAELAQSHEFSVVEGKLVSVMAVGGESTGTAVQEDNGTYVEIDMTSVTKEDAGITEGTRVQAGGYFVTVHGIEIPVRQILKVTTLKKIQ